jgi:hypothetical protein
VTNADIQHFLVIYDIAAGQANVKRYGADYDTALEAYEQAEETYRGRDDLDVVLLGADSIETIKKTHSSYFNTQEKGFERFFSVDELIAAAS